MLTVFLIIAAPLAIIALPAPVGHLAAGVAVVLLAGREWRHAREVARKQRKAVEEAATAAAHFQDSVSAYALLQARSRPVKRRAPGAAPSPADH